MKTEVIRRNLQYPLDWPQSKAIEKGIDMIAVAMIRLAMLGAMDAAILFSSGKDLLLPAIEVLWGLPEVAIEVACWSGARRLRLDGTQTPWCHNLNETDFLQVGDELEYSAPE